MTGRWLLAVGALVAGMLGGCDRSAVGAERPPPKVYTLDDLPEFPADNWSLHMRMGDADWPGKRLALGCIKGMPMKDFIAKHVRLPPLPCNAPLVIKHYDAGGWGLIRTCELPDGLLENKVNFGIHETGMMLNATQSFIQVNKVSVGKTVTIEGHRQSKGCP